MESLDLDQILSLGLTVVLLGAALILTKIFVPNANKKDKFTFTWMCYDALIHFILEGHFIYYSTFGRTPATETSFMARLWQEYAKADIRWGHADPTVVSLELLTVFGAGPLSAYIATKIFSEDPTRHYWIIVLSTAELYGGWMTFCPEWISDSVNLVTDNWIYLWLYLFFFNFIWVVIPVWYVLKSYIRLLWDSYHVVASSLRASEKKLK